MGKDADAWRERVAPHFGFLVEHGLDAVDVDDTSVWSLWVQYRSSTSAVRISKSREFIRVEVQLIRLVDEMVPAYPIWITDDRIDWTLLDSVVLARQPVLQDEMQKQSGLKTAEIESQLAFWAQTLRDVAPDFLDGDLKAIDEAGALVRAGVAAESQEVRVYLPDDAPADADVKQEASVRAIVPPNVGVTVRRYLRRGKAT